MTVARRVVLCREEDLPPGSARRFVVDGEPVVLARCEDGLHALRDVCSHEEFPLSEGEVFPEECEIECARHGSTFSLHTGEALCLPATAPVPVYEVVVDAGEVVVVLP